LTELLPQAAARHPGKPEDAERAAFLSLLTRVRPERQAGGFPHDDGTIEFYSRVNALLRPTMTVLDFGAGRGRQFDVPDPGYLQSLQVLQGKVARVIGVDIHEGIQAHPHLDARLLIQEGQPIPLPSSSVDIVVADWVLEHLANPEQFVGEMERLLRVGGWICARTVNRWGYVGIGARLVPSKMHRSLLRLLMPVGRTEDQFLTHYRMNTLRNIRRWFLDARWDNYSYLLNPTPRYCGTSSIAFRAIELYQRLMPYRFRTDLHAFLRRRK